MLYTFNNLAQKLTELGYPETNQTGFRIIRRDLTLEEQAGNIEYGEDGVYLTIDDQKFKGYMYLKYPDMQRFGVPKFHITNCQTVLDQKSSGRFDGRYFWHNSNNVTLEDRTNGQIHEDVNLSLCNNCRRQSNIRDYIDSQGFFDSLDINSEEGLTDEVEVDIYGYTLDWHQIRRAYKIEQGYTCERCRIQMENPNDRRFMHAHHKNGNKLNNRKSNLECLCILCHSFVDSTHQENFESRRMKKDLRSFVDIYRNRLSELGNEFLNTYLMTSG